MRPWISTVVGAYPVGAGRIQGGWEYVWAAYAVAWGAITLYALSLWIRRPKADGPKGKP